MSDESLFSFSNIVEVLKARAGLHPEKIAFASTVNGDSIQESYSYAELDRRARAIAIQLGKVVNPGDRALLLYKPGLEYIAAFLGCLYAGVVAVPAYPPEPKRLGRMLPRLFAITEDCKPRVVLTTSDLAWKLRVIFLKKPRFTFLRWLSTDTLSSNSKDHASETLLEKGSLAFLQYTSGSTGSPKGVMISHGNLMHNSKSMKRSANYADQDSVVTWLPLYHDMGLIGQVIHSIYSGMTVYIMSPIDFLKNPFNWLKAISTFKATSSGGPNFAYELCLSKIESEAQKNLDLKSWRMAFCGAEPIRSHTLNRFAAKFESSGFSKNSFYPCYGLAESTLIVTGETHGSGFKTDKYEKADFVSSGSPLVDDCLVKIVSPETLEECAQGEAGEIWTASPSVALGYWNKPELTRQIFGGYLKNRTEGPFLRTGDLGFSKNGNIYISGRLKDLIIINGKNHFSEDIEASVARDVLEIRPGCLAAFSIQGKETEDLIIVAELKKSAEAKSLEVIRDQIRTAIMRSHDLAAKDVIFIVAGTISKTTSGKIQRFEVKENFINGLFQTIAETNIKSQSPVNKTDLVSWMTVNLAQELGLATEQVSPTSHFGALGLTSLKAVSFASNLSRYFGREISPALFWEHQNLESLAKFLGGAIETPKSRNVETNLIPEEIAVVGLAACLPGSPTAEQFWQNLKDEKNLITEIPSGRWDSLPQKSHLTKGGWVKDIDKFDPLFFGVSPREAQNMDPQHRVILQVAWEAIENAGYKASVLSGKKVGVFIGASSHDYAELLQQHGIDKDLQVATGNSSSVISNRISFLMNFKGPSKTIDTACSSSLVAVHDAVRAIANGDCEMALAGGVNALLSPTLSVAFDKAGMLSPSGQCNTFDHRASGYVRGEGGGVVFLKKLNEALKDGDHVYAVIKGSGVNHGGHTHTLTAPNPAAQAALIQEVYEKAGVDPRTLGYIETHGTATSLGDPIEINGLKLAFKDLENDTPNSKCFIGSVKTNIGHLEAGAGIAGLIKVILAVSHKEIPASLNFEKLNAHADLTNSPFEVVTKTREWLPFLNKNGHPHPLRGAVSSFGFGGTNAHILIEEHQKPMIKADDSGPHLFILSAKNKERLKAYAQKFSGYLEGLSNDLLAPKLSDLAFTTQVGREAFESRLALVANSLDELRRKLTQFIDEKGVEENGGGLLHDLAQKWMRGEDVNLPVTSGQRVPLPTYPFLRDRYWFKVSGNKKTITKKISFNDFFIRDHVVVDRNILPGVMHLEFALQAAKEAFPELPVSRMTNVNWKRPVVVDEKGLSLEISLTRENEKINFSIASVGDQAIYSSGTIEGPGDENFTQVSIEDLKREMTSNVSRSDIYEKFETLGLNYGKSFQSIERLLGSAQRALGFINFSGEVSKEFYLNPALLDAALGVCVGIENLGSDKVGQVFIPYSVDEIVIKAPINGAVYSLARLEAKQGSENSKNYSVIIFSEDGTTLAAFKNIEVRALPVQASAMHLLEIQIRKLPTKIDHHSHDFETVSSSGKLSQLLSDNGENGCRSIAYELSGDVSTKELLEVTTSLKSLDLNTKAKVIFYYQNNNNENMPLIQSLAGLCHSISSLQALNLKMVGFDRDADRDFIKSKLSLEFHDQHDGDREIYYINGERRSRQFDSLNIQTHKTASFFSGEGVYLISGGAGGIGLEVARHICKSTRATVILLGRSTKANTVLPPQVHYYETDVTQLGQVEKTVSQVNAKFGKITGIIHAAGLAPKSSFRDVSHDEFSSVFNCKVVGLQNLDTATKGQELKFFLGFSSVSSFLGDFGAGSYAMGNRFLDSFMEWRTEQVKQGLRHGASLTINWPLWKKGGMQLPVEQRRLYEKILGLKALDTVNAMAALEACLSEEKSLTVLYGDSEKIRQFISPNEENHLATTNLLFSEVETSLTAALAQILGMNASDLDSSRDLMEYGADSMAMAEFLDVIKNTYRASLSTASLFQNPTIKDITNLVIKSAKINAPVKSLAPLAEKNLVFPLSYAQKALWFLYLLDRTNFSYNIPVGLKFTKAVDPRILRRSLEQLASRQPSLRTVIENRNSDVRQRILENAGVDFKVIEVKNENLDVNTLVAEEARKPFDLEDVPPFRAALFIEGPDESTLIMTAHHIIFDGLSLMLLMKQLLKIIESETLGIYAATPAILEYSSFVQMQEEFVQSAKAAGQLKFWKDKLSGELPSLDLPTDRARSPLQTFNGSTVSFNIEPDLSMEIKNFAKSRKTTVYSVLLSTFFHFLHRYSKQNDLVVGTPVLGRHDQGFENTIGYFVNMIAIRQLISEAMPFADLVSQVQKSTIEAFENQEYPFALLVEKLQFKRDSSRSPLFQACFVFQNMLRDPLFTDEGLDGTRYLHVAQQEGQFDVELEILEKGDAFVGNFKFNSDLFDKSSAVHMVESFSTLLKNGVNGPHNELRQIQILNETSLKKVSVDFNDTQKNYEGPHFLPALFEKQAEENPDAVALSFGGKTISYGDLNKKANRLGRYLVEKGVTADVLVGLLFDRSLEMVIAMYAVLKAGGAYVPLEPSYPEERLSFMAEDADLKVILTQEKWAAVAVGIGRPKIAVDFEEEIWSSRSDGNLGVKANADDLAYVIYTSGSTGEPKGAMITHRGICNRLIWMQEELHLTPGDKILQKTPFSFDVSVWEFFWPLMFGARLVILEPEMHKDSQFLVMKIRDENITVLHFVPSMLNVFLEEPGISECISLRQVICSGEALSVETQKIFFEKSAADLFNLYGPTEASVDVTFWKCDRVHARSFVPIGKPIANIETYILDKHLKPVPIGVAGELCLGGVGLARGYVNRPELTAEKFIPHPFKDDEKIYKTGDLARYGEDGVIQYLGRLDHQVKIRGFRIELGEIENCLAELPFIKEVVVTALSINGSDELAAYFVGHSDQASEVARSRSPEEIKAVLRLRLPEFMVPRFFVALPTMPLSANGKVDRKLLPRPDLQQARFVEGTASLFNATEEEMARVWREILHVDLIDRNHNFFELGGNSLLTIRVVHELNKNSKKLIRVKDFYERPVLKDLAAFITAGVSDGVADRFSAPHDLKKEIFLELKNPSLDQSLKTVGFTSPRKILLTGATGFLGAYLLHDLLLSTKAEILCLVRATDDLAGFDRVKMNLQRYHLWHDEFETRVSAVLGDLSKPRLGLDSFVRSYLAENIDSIYHNGARVNFIEPYSRLKNENVNATREIIALASEIKVKALHYVSTISVFASPTYSKDAFINEGVIPSEKGLYSGYSSSKWVAEQLVLSAINQGLPARIYRPGTISGDSKSGVSNHDDLLTKLMMGVVQMEAMPQLNRTVEMVPVELASQSIVSLSLMEHCVQSVFHISHPEPIMQDQFREMFLRLGYPVEDLSFSAWVEILKNDPHNALSSLLPLFTEPLDGQRLSPAEMSQMHPSVNSTKTMEILADLGIRYPVIDENLLRIYLKAILPASLKEKARLSGLGTRL